MFRALTLILEWVTVIPSMTKVAVGIGDDAGWTRLCADFATGRAQKTYTWCSIPLLEPCDRFGRQPSQSTFRRSFTSPAHSIHS